MDDNDFSGADNASKKLWIGFGVVVLLVLALSIFAPKPGK